MNFNVYLKKDIGEMVTKTAKKLHKSRNSIVAEALEEWLERHAPLAWPENFFNFDSIEDVPNFKDMRKDLKNVSEDPLA